MKTLLLETVLLVTFLGFSWSAQSQQPLSGTDELGRKLPSNETVGDPKSKKQVGIFYFLWMGHSASPTSPNAYDLSKITSEHPEVLDDFDHPEWGKTTKGGYYFWGKSVFDYYKGTDYWVHLKNIQLLADAGIDFLFLDATNGIHYPQESESLMRAIQHVLDQGRPAPRLVYYTNTRTAATMQKIYDDFYKSGAPMRYPDTWYFMDGKPLIIGGESRAFEENRDYKDFFTFRANQWPNEPNKPNGWPWISFTRPQDVYSNAAGEREVINVSIAQHPNLSESMGGSAFYGGDGNWGRSFRNNSPGNPDEDIRWGYNHQEQWDYAIAQDVPYVLVTGWNEWIVGRWKHRDTARIERSLFVDQASPEYSRDIEPSRTSGLADNYYMQLISNVRRYKGIEPNGTASGNLTISSMQDWGSVAHAYWDYVGDTQDRNAPSALSAPKVTYTNTTGRNDFAELKFSSDADNLYFYARTADMIVSSSSQNWMNVFINSDRAYATGWEGFDYRIVSGKILQVYNGKKWKKIGTVAQFSEGNEMYYVVSKKLIKGTNKSLDIEFKWVDNMQDYSDPLDWYVNGDAAPGGRLTYVVTSNVQ